MLKKRINHEKYSYIETAVLMTVFLSIGYFLNPDNICMLKSDLSYLTIFLAVITLFHGISNGLFASLIVAIAMYLFYPQFMYLDFLKELVLVLVFGEFHYYWKREISKHSQEVKYLNSKLDELGKSFYTLKISHDQLESNYVLKPMSLRNSIKNIKENYSNDTLYFDKFLTLLEKSFQVSAASIATSNDIKLSVIAQSDKLSETVLEDPLIQKVYETKRPTYISDETDKVSAYVAVIPAMQESKIRALLLIEKIPFMAFNKDNLIAISILFEYFYAEVIKIKAIQAISKSVTPVNENFVFEYHRLKKLHKKYNSTSSLIAFKTDRELIQHQLNEACSQYLRTIDVYAALEVEGVYYIIVLFAFADESSAKGFLNRVELKIDDTYKQFCDHIILHISQEKILKEYLKVDFNAF